jgi:hypothetical protein
MTRRVLCVFAVATVSAACAGRSQPAVVSEPAPESVTVDVPWLAFTAVDSATLASLGALLDRLVRDTSLLSALTPSAPRMYALFRELEAAQERIAVVLATPDATGQTLYDRLAAMTARTDSLFRAIEARGRHVPRP